MRVPGSAGAADALSLCCDCPHLLQSVRLARGGDDWQPEAAACTLQLLPALRLLEFYFSFDEEEPPQNLLSLLLLPQPQPDLLLPPQQPQQLHQQLQHLALVFPIRSVIPPTHQLPDELSTLTQVGGWQAMVLPPVQSTLPCCAVLCCAGVPALPPPLPHSPQCTPSPAAWQPRRPPLPCALLPAPYPACSADQPEAEAGPHGGNPLLAGSPDPAAEPAVGPSAAGRPRL